MAPEFPMIKSYTKYNRICESYYSIGILEENYIYKVLLDRIFRLARLAGLLCKHNKGLPLTLTSLKDYVAILLFLARSPSLTSDTIKVVRIFIDPIQFTVLVSQ